MRHKWTKIKRGATVCDKCKCLKYRASTRLLMAITLDGKSHYKYIQHLEYIPNNGDVTTKLPLCCIHEIINNGACAACGYKQILTPTN